MVWLWLGCKGVIVGVLVLVLYGVKWVDDYVLVELIWCNVRVLNGVWIKDELLFDGEV